MAQAQDMVVDRAMSVMLGVLVYCVFGKLADSLQSAAVPRFFIFMGHKK
jgi:hypothetical protein